MHKKILFSLALFFSVTANAYNVVYDGSGDVMAIGNLNIGGTLYNVDFESGIYSTFGGDEFFWVDSVVSLATVSATVNAVLNSEAAATTVIGNYYLVAETFDNGGGLGALVWQNGVINGTWVIGSSPVPDYENPGRTAWSVAAVPIPAGVWLFASALAGLGFVRRRLGAP